MRKRPRTYYILNLGCPKNEVDGQSLEYHLLKRRLRSADPEEADVLIVNTCGFIEPAKSESIDEILRLSGLKKEGAVLAVTGCLSQRYRDELEDELTEADFIFGLSAPETVAEAVVSGEKKDIDRTFEIKPGYEISEGRTAKPGSQFAYLKIADGCDNRCNYCAIPLIRGPYRSRPVDDILSEADYLLSSDIREIILVAQETTRYGYDLYDDIGLTDLIGMLTTDSRLRWLRILYTHPARIDIPLLEAIADNGRICDYLDIPLQHISDNMLTIMNRKVTSSRIRSLVKTIRHGFPQIALRTTFLVGHPGETEADFEELLNFVEENRFEHLGIFVYSPEEGTVSFGMAGKVESSIADERYDRLMAVQSEIVERKNEEMIGRTLPVVIDEYDDYNGAYLCRSQYQAPDIDGYIRLADDNYHLRVGDYIDLRIIGHYNFELEGALQRVKAGSPTETR
jgi:ribosomal protein S12 methylthiotransferase